jgi:hypothetical protein
LFSHRKWRRISLFPFEPSIYFTALLLVISAPMAWRLALVIYRHALTQACNDFDIVVAPRVSAQYPCQALLLDKPALTAKPNVEIYPNAKQIVTPNQARLWHAKAQQDEEGGVRRSKVD